MRRLSIKSDEVRMLADHGLDAIEFSVIENEYGTAKLPNDNHEAVLLAGQEFYKSECKIFDTSASQNVERCRFKSSSYTLHSRSPSP